MFEEQHENFVAAVTKWEMLAATNAFPPYIFSIKRVTKKFLEVSSCSRAKQWQRNVQKSVLKVQSYFFLLISPIVVFHHSPALPLPLNYTTLYFFEQSINIIESFAFSPG